MPDIETPSPSGGAAPSVAPSSSTNTPAPATAAPSASTSTPAVAQPAPATSGGQVAPSGEPPQDRWPDILENARKKTRAEVQQEFQQKYGHYDIFERDPWGAIQQWLGEASQHSMYGPHVKEWAQQFLQQSGGQQPRGEEPQADVPIVDQQGNPTGRMTYSADRLREWHKWNQVQQQQELDQRFSALESQNSERSNREQQQQAWQQATQQASQTLSRLRAMPYFTENEPAIRASLEQHEDYGDNIYAAYVDVLTNQILPKLGQAEQQKVINSLQSKSAGATVSPSGAVSGKPQFRNFREAAEYFAAHPDEAKTMADR